MYFFPHATSLKLGLFSPNQRLIVPCPKKNVLPGLGLVCNSANGGLDGAIAFSMLEQHALMTNQLPVNSRGSSHPKLERTCDVMTYFLFVFLSGASGAAPTHGFDVCRSFVGSLVRSFTA